MIRHLTPMTWGDRTTRERWLVECREARAAARGKALFIVAPRHSVATERGLLSGGAAIDVTDFVGFTKSYTKDDGTTGQSPLTPEEALQRAIDFGIVLDCRTARQHAAHEARAAAERAKVEADRLSREANEADRRAIEAERQAQA